MGVMVSPGVSDVDQERDHALLAQAGHDQKEVGVDRAGNPFLGPAQDQTVPLPPNLALDAGRVAAESGLGQGKGGPHPARSQPSQPGPRCSGAPPAQDGLGGHIVHGEQAQERHAAASHPAQNRHRAALSSSRPPTSPGRPAPEPALGRELVQNFRRQGLGLFPGVGVGQDAGIDPGPHLPADSARVNGHGPSFHQGDDGVDGLEIGQLQVFALMVSWNSFTNMTSVMANRELT